MYDVRNRTKNIDLRRSLDRMVCTLDKLQYEHSKHTRSNSKFVLNHHFSTDDLDSYDNDLRATDDLQQSIVGDGNRLIELRQIPLEQLPCTEDLNDPTELPLSRESIGMDLSWLSGNAMRNCDFGILVGVLGIIISFLVT